MTAALATIDDDAAEFRAPPLARQAGAPDPRRRGGDRSRRGACPRNSRKAPPRGIASASSLTRRWNSSPTRACSRSPCRRPTAGAGVRAGTVARVIAALSRADGSIGQIPQNHFFMLEGLRLQGTEEQKRFFYGRVLAGERLGNALSETGTKTAHDHATRLTRDGSLYPPQRPQVLFDRRAVRPLGRGRRQ